LTQTRAGQRTRQPPPAALEEFKKGLDAYLALHKKVDLSLPPLPDKATPEQINNHRVALATGIREGRATATQGEILTPNMVTYVKDLVAGLVAGPGGAAFKASIMDENPVGTVPKVNDPYPPEVPLSTMPPELLAGMPKLAEGLAYRFVGDALVLLDEQADLVVDFVTHVLPG
jgi:hypothetical protein